MKTMMKIATVAAVLVLAAGLVPTAEATCAGGALVQTVNPAGYISQVWTEDWFYGGNLTGNGFGFNNGVSYYTYIAPFAFTGQGVFLAPGLARLPRVLVDPRHG